MQCEPVQQTMQHAWLRKLVGDWSIEMDCGPNETGQPTVSTGSETALMLGDIWLICEGRCAMPDGKSGQTMMTLGFDPARGKFVGTWLGTMMTNLWVYEGELDAAGNSLTLNTDGPDFEKPGATRKYRDVISFKSDTHRTLTSHILGDDGKWTQFMQAHFRRK